MDYFNKHPDSRYNADESDVAEDAMYHFLHAYFPFSFRNIQTHFVNANAINVVKKHIVSISQKLPSSPYVLS